MAPCDSFTPLPPRPLWKRSIDLTAAAAALPLLAVLTAVLALVHAFVSPGPVFFRQRRVGYRGRAFEMYKFRTMHVAAATDTHKAHVLALLQANAPMRKIDERGDPRMVPGTWLLRASGLDELPQFLNVLRGEMSLVGPRPCLPYEYRHYNAAARRRCRALPGLTGLWQVSGKNRTTFETMIALDTKYCRTRSLWLDLRIVALTGPVLLGQILETRRRRAAAQRAAAASPAGLSPASVPDRPATRAPASLST